MKQKLEKKVFVAFELGGANCQNFEQDTCHRMSMCSQTHLKFHLTLGETFAKSTSLTMMKNIIKALSSTLRKYLGRFHMFTVKACSETVLLREFSNKGFHSL